MTNRTLRAAGSLAAVLLLLLLCIEGPAAQQVVVREIVSPRTDTIVVEDMFGDMPGAQTAERRLFGRSSMSSGSEPFGSRAAYIPFWQMMQLFRDFFPSREEGALVGGGAYYLPPDMTETHRQLALSILRTAGEHEKPGEQLRLELRLSSVPEVLLDGALTGGNGKERANFRVERISKSSGRGRYAVYTDGEHPKAVVSAEFRYFAPGFKAARRLEEGTELDSTMVYSSAVEVSRRSHSGRGEAGGWSSRSGSGGFSLEGLRAGYRYTLLEDVRQGEELDESILEVRAPVEGGERVQCLFRRGQLSLRIEGRALSSGALGENVRVRLSSGKLREMRVIGRGKVESEGTRG